jgi:MFS family permease
MNGLLPREMGRVAPYHTIRMPTAHPVAARVFVWMCVLTFVYELGFGAVVPVLALYARSFGVPGSALALALVYPSGIVVDRYGRKTVIVPASLVAGTSLSVFLLAPSYAWFVAGCLVWGLASGLSGAAPAAYAADVAPAGMNAAAMSAYRMLGDIGYVLGPLALGGVTDLLGVETALAVAAALLVLVGLAFARFAPETYASIR